MLEVEKKAIKLILFAGAVLLMAVSCSHKYNSNELDLAFYQWNMWPEEDASKDLASRKAEQSSAVNAPACGWEVLHRGIGKLTRIPATYEEHFSDKDFSGAIWYHCRFTLPEMWDHRIIGLHFEGISGEAEIFLNEKPAGSHRISGVPFDIDITDVVYYTRDNHLAIRITVPEPGAGGMAGAVKIISMHPQTE